MVICLMSVSFFFSLVKARRSLRENKNAGITGSYFSLMTLLHNSVPLGPEEFAGSFMVNVKLLYFEANKHLSVC